MRAKDPDMNLKFPATTTFKKLLQGALKCSPINNVNMKLNSYLKNRLHMLQKHLIPYCLAD